MSTLGDIGVDLGLLWLYWELQALAPKESIASGVANVTQSLESSACHYTWSTGARRYVLAVSVNPASRVFAGMNADAIKQGLVSSVVAETADSTVADIGQTAVFRAYSAAYVGARAYVKDRILQVNLEGVDAREKKDQVISLLKAAASRL